MDSLSINKVRVQAEISSITSQRSSFEHSVNSRQATPQVYARYLSYEHNLAALARKRILRKGLKNASQTHARNAQRREFALLQRGTKKFHGDLALWTQYLEACRKAGAHKRHERVLTEVLRLFPKRPEVWRYATGHAERQGDIRSARGYLMRGTRFCERDWGLYLEWAKVELRWLSKIRRRRQTLGLDAIRRSEETEEDDKDADVITLPTITAGETEGKAQTETDATESALHKLDSTPAMSGAIPKAIFDSAMSISKNSTSIAEKFFNLFAENHQLACIPNILDHVSNHMTQVQHSTPLLLSCQCRRPIIGLVPDSPAFPSALRETLSQVRKSLSESSSRRELAQYLTNWLQPLAQDERLIPELRKVLNLTLRRVVKEASMDLQAD